MSQRGKKAEEGLKLVEPKRKQFFKLVDIQSPPFSVEARIKVGQLLRRLENGERLQEPDWKPMTKSIGPGCGELRVRDGKIWWRVVHYVDADILVVLHLFQKQTEETPDDVKDLCEKRLRDFKAALKG